MIQVIIVVLIHQYIALYIDGNYYFNKKIMLKHVLIDFKRLLFLRPMKIVKSSSTTNDKSFTDSGLSENYGM